MEQQYQNHPGGLAMKAAYFYLFFYLFIITGQAALPMRPGGEQHPKKITHTLINCIQQNVTING